MPNDTVVLHHAASPMGRWVRPWRAFIQRRATLLAVLTFGTVAALMAARAISDLNIPGVRSIHHHLWLGDFRDAIYYAVVAFLDGSNPYDTAAYLRTYPVSNSFPMYSPATLLVYLPFGLMPFELSEAVYFFLTMALTLLLAWISLRQAGEAPRAASVCMVATAVMLSRPGYWNQLLGQCTIQIVIGTYLALRYGRERPWLAAVGLTLSGLKPTYGIALVLLMLARGELRAVLIGAVLSVALALGPLLAVVRTAGGWLEFLAIIPRNYGALQSEVIVDPVSSVIRIDAVGVLGHLTGRNPSLAEQLAISLGVLGLGMFVLRRMARHHAPGAQDVTVLVACLTMLTFTYHQNYDLLLLTLPMTALCIGRSPLWQEHAGLRRALLGLLLVPAANHLLAGRVVNALSEHPLLWLAVTSANGVALCLALILAVGLAVRLAPVGAVVGGGAADSRAGSEALPARVATGRPAATLHAARERGPA